jgi:hypothetical protein
VKQVLNTKENESNYISDDTKSKITKFKAKQKQVKERNNGYTIKIISKVRKIYNQNPKFDHTQCEIFLKLAKNYINMQGGVKLIKPSSILVVN